MSQIRQTPLPWTNYTPHDIDTPLPRCCLAERSSVHYGAEITICACVSPQTGQVHCTPSSVFDVSTTAALRSWSPFDCFFCLHTYPPTGLAYFYIWRPEGQLGRSFWAKPVLRRFSGPRIGSVGASCFVDDFVSCWASGVHSGCCLNPVGGSFWLFRFVWWLDCLLLKEGASAFCSLRWLLEVFLAVAEFVGFRAGGRLPCEWLYWILYCPLLAPLAPLDSYRSFQPRKNMHYDYDLFSQSRY